MSVGFEMRVANGRYNEARVQQGYYRAVKRTTNRLQCLIAAQMSIVEMDADSAGCNHEQAGKGELMDCLPLASTGRDGVPWRVRTRL